MARLALLGLAACGTILYFIRPDATPWLPACPFYRITGLWCPGCGTTRMLYFLVHGHLLQAFRQNPMSMAALPALCYALTRHLQPGWRTRLPPIPHWLTYTFGALLLVFAVLRNVPAEPFRWLAPL